MAIEHRRWWRNPSFWIALFLSPIISAVVGYFAAQMGSNRAIERKQAAFEVTTNNLSEQFRVMRGDFNTLSAQINGKLGDIGWVKATTESQAKEIARLLRQQEDQNAYNFNVNKTLTEIVTTMRLRGLPTPAIPKPPKFKREDR